MLLKNKNIVFEQLEEDSYYTLLNDSVIMLNKTAYYIYIKCEENTFQEIFELCSEDEKMFPDKNELFNDLKSTISQLLELGLIYDI